MDHVGKISLIEVEVVEGEFNENLTIAPFMPHIKLIDIYGA